MEFILNNIKDSIDVMTSRIKDLEDSGNRSMSPEILRQEIEKLKNLSPKLICARKEIETAKGRIGDSQEVWFRAFNNDDGHDTLKKTDSCIKI